MSTYGKRLQGAKIKRRKSRFLKGYRPWMGIHKETRQRANRHSRHNGGVTIEARTLVRVTPPQGKHSVASNRCGNACGRRAAKGDYLCHKCRA